MKLLENFHDSFLANDAMLFLGEVFSKVTFFANKMGILGVGKSGDEIDLDDNNNFCEDDPETIMHVKILAWHNKFKICKTLKEKISK